MHNLRKFSSTYSKNVDFHRQNPPPQIFATRVAISTALTTVRSTRSWFILGDNLDQITTRTIITHTTIRITQNGGTTPISHGAACKTIRRQALNKVLIQRLQVLTLNLQFKITQDLLPNFNNITSPIINTRTSYIKLKLLLRFLLRIWSRTTWFSMIHYCKKNDQLIQSQVSSIRNFEVQNGQLANDLRNRLARNLPRNIEAPHRDEKEQCKVITLRSNKTLLEVTIQTSFVAEEEQGA